jgi:membrane protein involved in D-alanine export
VIPYADSFYFSILLYPAVAAIALGLAGRLSWRWVLGINLAMLLVQYGSLDLGSRVAPAKIWVLAAYGAFQWAVVSAFLRVRRRVKNKHVFRAAVILTLLPVAAVKVFSAGAVGSFIGFLGISYVTFRSLDVVFCVQDGLVSSLSLGRYIGYLFFFPAISAGPLDRYKRFESDCARRRTRAEFIQDLDAAVHRVFTGLLYSFIIAALVKKYWVDPVATAPGLLNVVSYMYGYTFYLFFDFAGYSAFAIGIGYLFGVHTPENFNRPFLAVNIVDFWNRWHMTLSTWFRDHVYMRFVMAAMRGRWFANKLTLSCVGFYVSFGLMGVWHGIAPRYVVYGLYHATLMSAYTIWEARRRQRPRALQRLRPNIIGPVLTFHCVCVGLLIFSGRLG